MITRKTTAYEQTLPRARASERVTNTVNRWDLHSMPCELLSRLLKQQIQPVVFFAQSRKFGSLRGRLPVSLRNLQLDDLSSQQAILLLHLGASSLQMLLQPAMSYAGKGCAWAMLNEGAGCRIGRSSHVGSSLTTGTTLLDELL